MGLFGNENKAQVKKLKKIADKVVALEEKYKSYTDEQLKACTEEKGATRWRRFDVNFARGICSLSRSV